jgi:hypothetical protein
VTSLIDFIEAQLAEDEAAARTAIASHQGRRQSRNTLTYSNGQCANGGTWRVKQDRRVKVLSDCGHLVMSGNHSPEPDHIARHDPARVLREVAAKRDLLNDIIAEKHRVIDDPWYTCSAATEDRDGGTYAETEGGGPCTCGRDERVERLLRLLAAPFSDHPDYNPEWSTT